MLWKRKWEDVQKTESTPRHGAREISLSVSDLLRILYTWGDLHGESDGNGVSAADGQAIHARVQRKYRLQPDALAVEMPLVAQHKHRTVTFKITGRIDLGARLADSFRIIEIKSSASPLQTKARVAADPLHPHRVQACLYAYLAETGLAGADEVSATLMYESSRSGATQWLDVFYNRAETLSILNKLLDAYVQNLHLAALRKRRQDMQASRLRFPFPSTRNHQDQLVAEIESALGGALPVLIDAPTGSGKTISSLFPALRSAAGRGKRVVFGTSKNAQKIAAAETVRILERGQANRWARPSAVVLGSRENLCIHLENPVCSPSECPYAKGYYRKVREGRLLRLFARGVVFDTNELKRLGHHFQVCAFELSLDLSHYVDVVVCDYNHIVSPRAQIARLFGSASSRRSVQLIIDEAHNFSDRVRSEYSPLLPSRAVRTESRASRRYIERVTDAIAGFCQNFLPASHDRDAKVHLEEERFWGGPYEALHQALLQAYARYTTATGAAAHNDPVMKQHQDFLTMDDLIRSNTIGMRSPYSLIVSRQNESYQVQLLCKDATDALKGVLADLMAPLFMSATLQPFEHYARLFGFLPAEIKSLSIPSPFDPAKRKLFIIPQVTTRYRDREQQVPKIARCISRLLDLQRVNTFVFFPSFDFARRVHHYLALPERVLLQTAGMSKEDIRDVLDRFRSAALDEPQTLFAVHGGAFSEGVDLPGDALRSVIVVGPALPKVSLEQQLTEAYVNCSGRDGFDEESVVPAMARVNQAMGRLVRTSRDRGTCFLLDCRFTDEKYFSRLAPEWVTGRKVTDFVSSGLGSELEVFWEGSALPVVENDSLA
jgi:DNA excision repair protein ERCC-2